MIFSNMPPKFKKKIEIVDLPVNMDKELIADNSLHSKPQLEIHAKTGRLSQIKVMFLEVKVDV